ncbi:MAG: chorismate pyruvate-lyase family protein [Gemmatimonadetes bacterium]|nr:chorismate pyruvate-lyase family protein [Gemmatimonadota bacterium]
MKTDSIFNSTTFVDTHVKNIFIAQAERPAMSREINIARLTPFQRALIVTDGTVTRLIEAYTLAPVEVALLHQTKQTLCTEHIWLELPSGTPVIARQAVLQTPSTDNETPKIQAYATSLIVSQNLPKGILDGLESDPAGLGGILQNSGLETRRELLWCCCETARDLPETIAHLEGKPLLSRTYRVFANKKPIMLITEKFPLREEAH